MTKTKDKMNGYNCIYCIQKIRKQARREVFDKLEKVDVEHSHISYKDIMGGYKEIIKREKKKCLGDVS